MRRNIARAMSSKEVQFSGFVSTVLDNKDCEFFIEKDSGKDRKLA